MKKVNKVGIGTFPLSGVFNKITPKKAEYVLNKFLDEGGYYIDTAPLYGNGKVESLLGRVLKNINRDKYYLITKTVKIVDENGNLTKSGKKEDVVRGLEYSLKRLGIDYVDQLMVHSPDENVPVAETLDAMEALQKQGKVKDLAVSNVNLNELKEYNKTGKIKYIQNRFSLINRSLSSEFESYLIENNIFLIPYHLLEIGMLTDSVFKGIELRKNDLRENLPYWNYKNQQIIFEWVRKSIAPLAKEVNCTIGQLNIAWALKQKYIDFVIVGTTNPANLADNLKASNINLSGHILNRLDIAYKDFEIMIKEKYNKSVREFRGLNEKYY
jgi:aryl-alcohol dehydrogenase-like predicted oxidoreductase